MMADFKMARECNQHKPDNIVDATGYLGINFDLKQSKKVVKKWYEFWK